MSDVRGAVKPIGQRCARQVSPHVLAACIRLSLVTVEAWIARRREREAADEAAGEDA